LNLAKIFCDVSSNGRAMGMRECDDVQWLHDETLASSIRPYVSNLNNRETPPTFLILSI
jgi:hypothetical protein